MLLITLSEGQRDPAQGHFVFRPGGARPPLQAMAGFVAEQRHAYGVEPIYRVLRYRKRTKGLGLSLAAPVLIG